MISEHLYFENLNACFEEKKEIKKWMQAHQEPIIIKEFLHTFRRNFKYGLHPTCPHCNETFSVEDLNHGIWAQVNIINKEKYDD